MNLYPLLLDLSGKEVVIIGGGIVAYRKAKGLVDTGALLKIIAPHFCEEIIFLQNDNPESIICIAREYQHGDLRGACLAIAATNNAGINKTIHVEASELHIFINAVDDPEHCSFFVPSIIRKGDLVISVSTSGASPTMARKIRKDIEQQLPDDLGKTLNILRHMRELLKKMTDFAGLESLERGKILQTIVENEELLAKMVEAYNEHTEIEFLQHVSEYITRGKKC